MEAPLSPARGRAFAVLRGAQFTVRWFSRISVAIRLAMNRIDRLLGSILFKLRRQVSALAWLPRHLA